MEVKIENDGFGAELICPKCGCNNLHQMAVDAYFRNEDAVHGMHTRVDFFTTKTDMDVSGNPSARRSGLFITFDCEQCEGDKMLNVYQHKGTTYLEWSYE
jgi:predicted nucleic-acid-binding Zn-ribbon protein